MPAMRGTGAVRNYFNSIGNIGISTCYHLNGNNNPKNA